MLNSRDMAAASLNAHLSHVRTWQAVLFLCPAQNGLKPGERKKGLASSDRGITLESALRVHRVDVSSDRLGLTVDLMTDVNRIFASSFDLSETLPRVAQLCVSDRTDGCVVDAGAPETPHVPLGASRSAVVLPEASQLTIDSRFKGRMERAGFPSVLVAEVRAADETYGKIALLSQRPGAFDELDSKLAQLMAMRIAVAIQTVSTFTREHRVADRLQRALLPDSFPEVEGVTFGGAYRPAGSEAEVGGDWYDAFRLPDGRIALSIGDVAGHGLDAAVIMGEVRQALRAAAIGADRPSAVLEAVNGVINLRSSIGMVTAIFGYYDPQHCVLRYAVAGHPPPIIATCEGFAQVLPSGGLPLGAAPSVQSRDWVFSLPPGGQIVFYTDGLIEYGHDLEAGQNALLEAITEELMAKSGSDPADAIQARIFRDTPNKDDAATLTLTRTTQVSSEMLLTFSAIPLVSALVRSTLRQVAPILRLPDDETFALLVAVGEAIANAVEHAYGEREPGLVEIKTLTDGSRFIVQVDDHGRWRPFQQREERGRGSPLMHALVDGVQIKSSQTNTSITLTLDLERAQKSA
ncbi:MAG: hypothetical protein NVS1B14_04330 [Vulcanimicrobiaceae bacterium]